MFPKFYYSGKILKLAIANMFVNRGEEMTTEKWQGVAGRKMIELLNVAYQVPIVNLLPGEDIKPNLPWADEHFEERVSGIPYNPPPSNVNWPFKKNNHGGFKKGEKFSHTYPERFWPKQAADSGPESQSQALFWKHNRGIRFAYGDLQDVINLLIKEPNTRQAYLPIWFPEDTGVVHGERVPCSIGYHFQMRHGFMHCSYTMRSCDFLLHWDDDMFFTMRLTLHILSQLHQANPSLLIRPGILNCQIYNLHHFYEGKYLIEKIRSNV